MSRPPVTRVTLFVPGAPASLADWNQALARDGLHFDNDLLGGPGIADGVSAEWIANDGAFGPAFSFGTVEPATVAVIDEAPGALLLQWPIDLREGREAIVAAVSKLRTAGAYAVRLEESKLGWEVTRWIERFSSDDPRAWHRGAVTFLSEDGVLQSCGMHAFSLPDVSIELDGDAAELQAFAEELNARTVPKLVFTFMPSLHALLLATERKQRRPLTQQQVEATRDGAPCIAMEPRDAQKLERARGYADLEPELAWEQWQLVREAVGSD